MFSGQAFCFERCSVKKGSTPRIIRYQEGGDEGEIEQTRFQSFHDCMKPFTVKEPVQSLLLLTQNPIVFRKKTEL